MIKKYERTALYQCNHAYDIGQSFLVYIYIFCCVSSIYNRILHAFVFNVVELLEDFCVRSRCQKADNNDADQAEGKADY